MEARNDLLTPSRSTRRAGKREREDSFSSGMSLDVLAQVATETLEKEPVPPKRPAHVMAVKRTPRAHDMLSVPQIRALSDKALVMMFSELTSNELRRNYMFKCFLMPDECEQTFSSFGNEEKAKMMMKSHLLTHLADLEKKGNLGFAAEPLQARRKRIAAETVAQKKAKKKLKEWAAASGTPDPYRHAPQSGTFTSMKPIEKSISRRSDDVVDDEYVPSTASDTNEDPSSDADMDDDVIGEKGRPGRKRRRGRPAKKPLSRRFTHKKSHTVSRPRAAFQEEQVDVEMMGEIEREIVLGEEQVKNEIEETIAHNEQFIMDILHSKQPYHDHCYTSLLGKRQGIETLQLDSESLDELKLGNEDDTARTSGLKYKVTQESNEDDRSEFPEGTSRTLTLRVNAGSVPTVNNVHIPIIRLARIPVAPDGTPLISAEEVVIQEEGDEYSGFVTSSAQKPYPPMPKSELARKGRVAVPEEELSSDEEGLAVYPSASNINTASLVMAAHAQKDTKRKMLSHGTGEWERKLALRCIRDLRGKKRDDEPLVCKICKDKEFTATATLMYHYRSHAGIKPFVCLICHTTFTRQHSLNYHMLIHNNQSRFTCKECGRKFRHPSHFKEHLRRHTGETPFHCADCPLRFKTRNTYKRHLKTRHGKLLTAEGIKSANPVPSQEFFIQIPATQARKLKGVGDSEEEVDIDGEEDQYVDDVEIEPEERVETVTTSNQPHYIIQEQPHASQMYEHAQLQYQPPADGTGVVVEPTAAAAASQLSAAVASQNKLLQFCAVVNQEIV